MDPEAAWKKVSDTSLLGRGVELEDVAETYGTYSICFSCVLLTYWPSVSMLTNTSLTAEILEVSAGYLLV